MKADPDSLPDGTHPVTPTESLDDTSQQSAENCPVSNETVDDASLFDGSVVFPSTVEDASLFDGSAVFPSGTSDGGQPSAGNPMASFGTVVDQ